MRRVFLLGLTLVILFGQVAVLAQPGLSGTREKASESGSVRLSISDNALG
jgi:hypothetical protein